jgi:flagellar hook-associated protein 1 FlgK
MASIFNSLAIGYSGLNAAQVGIDTTGHNITNANTDGYSRQRVMTQAAPPMNLTPGAVGNGTQIQSIERIFNQFTFDSYTSASADKQSSDFTKNILQQVATYFPEMDGVGIKSDLSAYYDMWQSLADNPDNNAVKVALAQQAQVLTQHIQTTQAQVSSLQGQLNDQLKTNIDEVNRAAKQIADLNIAIGQTEAGGANNANDLRDQRNTLESTLSNLVGANVLSGQIESNNNVDPRLAVQNGSYSISINGFNIVDGSGYHPITYDNKESQSSMYNLYYQRQDGAEIPFTQQITGGSVGALLNLRGSALSAVDGKPTDGVLQGISDQLDMFAAGLIQTTNNIYSQSATSSMSSNPVISSPSDALTSSGLGIKKGSFDLILYDLNGKEVSKRTINIDNLTTFTSGTNSIKSQIEANKDDNADNNANNDIDDFLTVSYASGSLGISLKNSGLTSQGYTFAIEDSLNSNKSFNSGTNFAGAMGMNRFFEGTDASNISLASKLAQDPTKISANTAPTSGNNAIAMNMVQSQFENIDFTQKNSYATYNDTIYGLFDTIATNVGTQANAAIAMNNTYTARFTAAQQEYDSVSKVSMDEEMSNLIKYQTSYGACAKIITTIDQMMTTLLGIKQ